LGLALAFMGCASLSPLPKLYIYAQWRIEQEALAVKTENRSYEIPPWIFRWEFRKGPYICPNNSKQVCLGTFDPVRGKIIVAEPTAATVVRHEACHAILFALGRKDFGTYCDPKEPGAEGAQEHSLDKEGRCMLHSNQPGGKTRSGEEDGG